MDTVNFSPQFNPTQWTLIILARGSSPFAAESLNKLCKIYWPPLYCFLRGQGHSHESASDLTQGFFAQLLTGNFLEQIHPAKGRFRSYLLACLKNFVSNERDKQCAQKRGGGRQILSLEQMAEEASGHWEPSTDLSPGKLFDRKWALTVLEQAFARFKRDFPTPERFDLIKPLLSGTPPEESYKELAPRLGTTEGALKTSVHRLRKEFKKVFWQVVLETVETPEQVQSEIRELLLALQD